MLNIRIDGTRPRGRAKLRWMDRLKDDMKQNKIRSEWASDRENWFEMMKNVNILPGKRRKGETGETMQCVQLTVESICADSANSNNKIGSRHICVIV